MTALKRIFLIVSLVLCANSSLFAGQIIIGQNATDLEKYAAKELQRYMYHLTGNVIKIKNDKAKLKDDTFIIGQNNTNSKVQELVDEGLVAVSKDNPGSQGYILKKVTVDGKDVLVIAGSDAVGCLYGVYGLLDDHYDIGFYFSGDILPEEKKELTLPDIYETKKPAVYIRGFLPWTNFPQSATVYSWDDWRYIIDTAAKMRMNLIHVHNYNFGTEERGHNEMYHNFEYQGYLSRVWMPTARTGHIWRGPEWDVNKYLWGASDLFGDYDFGTDATLHNKNLSNQQVFDKGRSMFQKVIDYAHKRGVMIGLGLDIDLIPQVYNKKFGVKADNPELIEARVEQITRDYPDLDVLFCFHSESPQDEKDFWQRIFDGFYKGMKEKSPDTKIAVAGWGLKPEFVENLPEDVICAPIAAYSDKCVSGAEYGDREFWGCPWLERDFRSSQYYYPYNIHLSNTIDAWQNRADNMKGFYCLTWRLTDAVDPKMSYIAKAPWDKKNKYDSSRDVYYEYARRSYGKKIADTVINIIDQNEPFASGFGECQPTPYFSGTTRPDIGGWLFNISKFTLTSEGGKTKDINAVDYDRNQGTRVADCAEGGKCLGYIGNSHWTKYEQIQLPGTVEKFQARVASATQGGAIEIRKGGPSGEIIGVCEVPKTSGWQKWVTVYCDLKPIKGKKDISLSFVGPEINDLPKAERQLAVIDSCLENTENKSFKARLEKLRCRIQAAHDHIVLEQTFPYVIWDKLPSAFRSWARNFTHRVDDISSLGNVQSSQNRFVQLRYLAKENELRDKHKVKAPSYVTARGTEKGALITWKNEEKNAKGFNIYRDSVKINDEMINAETLNLVDKSNGDFEYTVTAIDKNGKESPRSVPAKCSAGDADNNSPLVVVISEPISAAKGQSRDIIARILDNRTYDSISAKIRYRNPGDWFWKTEKMERRTKAVFGYTLPERYIDEEILEYYIEVTDGDNKGYFPPAAPEVVATMITFEEQKKELQSPDLKANGNTLKWNKVENAFWYKIYRSPDKSFDADASDFVTYVYKSTTSFEDNAEGFAGEKLKGDYYYKVTAVDKNDFESRPSDAVKINW